MNQTVVSAADWVLTRSGLQYWPVTVRHGIAQGARWTLYPWSSYWRGRQEPALHRWLVELGDIRGWSCWDLGAHFGIYSIGLARRVGPTGAVAAFEPNPFAYARLDRHRKMNALTWMKSFDAAVSERSGTAEFYTYGDLKSTSTHLPYEGETPGGATQPISVNTIQLDELVAKGVIRAPNLIKVDVEGHGHKALAGARESIKRTRPFLIVAIHTDLELHGVREVLQPLNYSESVLGTHAGDTGGKEGHDLLFSPN